MSMVDDKLLVSIGMPVYNGEKCIRRAIDSLLAQDYENFELIVSDNASTDGTWQICQEYTAKDTRIRLNLNKKNLGARANFQLVLDLAQGPYFMWAAADDYWYPEFVAALVSELGNSADAGVAMCATERRRGGDTLYDVVRFTGEDDPNGKSHLSMCLAFMTPKKYNLFFYGLFKTDVLRSATYLMPRISAADRWFLCMLSLGTRFTYVDKVLCVKQLYNAGFSERFPDDDYSRIQYKSEGKLVDFRPVFVLGRNILQAEFIPWYRKCYLPLILVKCTLFQLSNARILLKKRLKSHPLYSACRAVYQGKSLRRPRR